MGKERIVSKSKHGYDVVKMEQLVPTFEFRDVEAARSNDWRSPKSSCVDISVRNSTALAAARWKDSAIVVG
jgi:hypothetical protein